MSPKSRKAKPHFQDELVEIVDDYDRPLAVMSLSEAHRQALMHRAVLVLVYNSEGKVYLQKRSQTKRLYPGRWDISATGHVQAHESREEAALRELKEELNIDVSRLKFWRGVKASAENNYEFISLFSAGIVDQIPKPRPGELEGGFFADSNELAYLTNNFREQLTPGLVYVWKKGLIFPHRPDEVVLPRHIIS